MYEVEKPTANMNANARSAPHVKRGRSNTGGVTERVVLREFEDARGGQNPGNAVSNIEKFMDENAMLPPIDHNKTVYKIFFLQGLGMLFPWNIYITAQSYYAHRFEHTPNEKTFTFWFSTWFQVANILGLGVAVYYGHKFNMRFSVAVPMVINAIVLMGTTALVKVGTVTAEDVFLITCGSVIVCGICTALLQLGIFGLAGRFPNVYMQAVMSGQGMSGISVSLISIFSTLAEPAEIKDLSFADVQESAFFYFLVATIVIIITLFAFNLMSHLDFAQYYAFADTQWEQAREAETRVAVQESPLVQGKRAVPDTTPLLLRLGGAEENNIVPPFQRSIMESPVYSRRSSPSQSPRDSPCTSPGRPGGDVDYEETNIPASKLLCYIWKDAVSVFFVFFLTLCVFPGVTSEIRSVKNPDNVSLPAAGRFYGDLWVPFSFLCFNTGDTLGRIIAAYVKLSSNSTFFCSILRFVFVPLFLNCNVQTTKTGNGVVPYFDDDLYPILFMVIMAMSNGFLASSAMMNGPDNVPPSSASKAGTLMAFFLELGLVLGCSFSFALQAIACKCNPFDM